MSLLLKEIPEEIFKEIKEAYSDFDVKFDLGSDITEFTVTRKLSYRKKLSDTPEKGTVLNSETFEPKFRNSSGNTKPITAISIFGP